MKRGSKMQVYIVHVLISDDSAKVIEHCKTDTQAYRKSLLVNGGGYDGPYPADRFPVGSVVTVEDLES